jgi:hypothetical protein
MRVHCGRGEGRRAFDTEAVASADERRCIHGGAEMAVLAYVG